MPLNLQSRLLRVLAEREVLALGSDKPKKADLHVISASHKDLRVLIGRGGFREDLYYRLNGATLELPALRHRQDISFVVGNIVAEESKLRRTHFEVSTEVEEIFERYPWPGNCRQLRNVLQFAMALTDDDIIKAKDLPDDWIRMARHRKSKGMNSRASDHSVRRWRTFSSFDKRLIARDLVPA